MDCLDKNSNAVDLVIFMGQSNMAGRGNAAQAPSVPSGHGYEFRAISDPTKLYDIIEPFGVDENIEGGIRETVMKTGSCVASFVNAYYSAAKIPIVGVSASKGGSTVIEWQPGGALLTDAISRYSAAKTWLAGNGHTIRHRFMVWLQGETDGDNGMSKSDYITYIKKIIEEMVRQGIGKCFVIRVGNRRDKPAQYDEIMAAQTELCKTYDKAVLISARLAGYASSGLMKDEFHYLQAAYNEFGTEAGLNAAYYVNTGKEPQMYDAKYDNLYYSHKL